MTESDGVQASDGAGGGDPHWRQRFAAVPIRRSEVRDHLESHRMSPRHRFGQNFLCDPGRLEAVVAAAEPEPGEFVLEPGPGLGALSAALLGAGTILQAVEIDRGYAEWLRAAFADEPSFRLLEGDVMGAKSRLADGVLEVLPKPKSEPWSVVSNLPYAISSPFLGALPLLPQPPRRVTAMLQAEVGAVLAAGPGDEDYSPLSLLARLAFSKVERVLRVPPSAFFPAPKVDSVVMRCEVGIADREALRATLALGRRLFQSRRKALGGTLGAAASELFGQRLARDEARALLGEVGIDERARIAKVTPEALTALAARLQELATSAGED